MDINKRKCISDAIEKSFLRVVKNHGYFGVVRKVYLKSDSPLEGFKKCTPFNVTVGNFARQAEDARREHKMVAYNDDYEYITVFINMLIRTYLENSGKIDVRELGMLGQEIFDLSCYRIFGNQYLTDMEQMNQICGNMRPPRDNKEAWLMSEYMNRIKSGERLDFETFMNERTNVPDEAFWEAFQNTRAHVDDEYEEEEYDDEGF